MARPAPEILRFASLARCHAALGEWLVHFVQTSIDRQGYCTIALAGGTTPAALYRVLSSPPLSAAPCWTKAYFFFGDERVVPLHHPDSNFMMAQQNLLAKLPIADDHIFRMPAEIRPYAAAARDYQHTLAGAFAALTGRKQPYAADDYPAFDLILLGMGADGHTASLFPGHAALQSTDWVAAVTDEQARPAVPRLTLTLPVINHADTALFLVTGAEKIDLADSFLSGPPQPRYPASLVRPRHRLLWYMADERLQCQIHE